MMLNMREKISIAIPSSNQRNTIRKIFAVVCAASVTEKEIIIVDDSSRDGTRDVLSSGDVIIIQDADHEYAPQGYPLLIEL